MHPKETMNAEVPSRDILELFPSTENQKRGFLYFTSAPLFRQDGKAREVFTAVLSSSRWELRRE
jgi:hypothetical protein